MLVMLEKGHQTSREALLRRFVDIQYDAARICAAARSASAVT